MSDFRLINVGRGPDNDVVLTHKSVSRYHLRIFIDPDHNTFVTDLDSSNGTFVNGNRILGTVQLQKGDILKAGFERPIRWMEFVDGELAPRISQETNADNEVVKKASTPILKRLIRQFLITLAVLFALTILFVIDNEFFF